MAAVCQPHLEHGESARERILRAAARLYASRGFSGTSIREIADTAGVKKPLVFYHFETKENLYRTLFVEAIGVACEGVERVVMGARDARTCLKGILETLVDLARCSPEVYAFVHEVMTRPDRIPSSLGCRTEGDRLLRVLRGAIDQGKLEGIFRDCPTDLILGLPLGVVGMYVTDVLSGVEPEIPESLAACLYDMVSRGVEVRGA